MENKTVTYWYNGSTFKGLVKMIYTDAITSGVNEYVPVTYLLIEEIETKIIHSVMPRYVTKIE